LGNKIASVIGITLIILAGIGVIYPVSDIGFTIITLNDLCNSDLGQLAQLFERMTGSVTIDEKCSEIRYTTYAIFGIGLIGIIIVIIGAIIPSKTKEKTLTCPYCNFVALSNTEIEKHKADNHLEKSPYKCGHCNFIGLTEEILWNHYVEKHPNEKRW